MSSLVDHKDRLSNHILVFGAAGILIYAGMMIGSFIIKHSVQFFGALKGLGL